ncbi:MAG: uracil-DNA glycosylase, partial [bacterium]
TSPDIIRNAVLYLEQQKLYGTELFFESPLKKEALEDYGQWKNLNEVEVAVNSCQRCQLAHHSSGKIMGAGNKEVSVMVIADTPAIVEKRDKQADLLVKILAAIEFTPKDVYTSSILKCNPPDKRKPLKDEISCCMPYLLAQIEIIAPKIILVLGEIAARALLGNEKNLKELRKENYHTINNAFGYVTYHPADLLSDNDPNQKMKKKMVWEDVQSLRRRYDKIVGDKPKWQ